MTKNAIKHCVASVALGLTLCFIIANWNAARTSASNGLAETNAAPHATIEDPANLLDQLDQGPLMHIAAHQAGGAQGDKPVEQTAKNIKVLNGLPSSKLFPVMNFFGDSLGVRCSYCHVQNGDKWDFASDAKEEKETAREMIKMVQTVNKESFSGNTAITCYTCHRGQARVIGLPPFPLPSRESMTAEAPKHDESGLPTADQLFDKYIQAIGGKPAFDKLKTRVWKGTFINAAGQNLPFEIQQESPDKFLSMLTTPKQGVFLTGYNGTNGWSQNSRGTRVFSGTDVAQFKRLTAFFGGINLKEQYTKMRVVGKDKIGDREAYIMRAVNLEGNNERLYFDTQSGLLLRSIAVEKTNIVPIPEQIDFEDYRDVDGVKLPFTIKVYNIDASAGATRKFTEVKHNVPLDDAKFNTPPADKPKPEGVKQ
jgi:photosynthetic reaction center cytochrome c subunit